MLCPCTLYVLPLVFLCIFPFILWITASLSCIIPTFMYYPLFLCIIFLFMYYCHSFMHYPHNFYVLSLVFLCIVPFILWITASLSCIIPTFMYYLLFLCIISFFLCIIATLSCIIPTLFYVLSLLMDTHFPDLCFSLSNPCIFPRFLSQCIYHSYDAP